MKSLFLINLVIFFTSCTVLPDMFLSTNDLLPNENAITVICDKECFKKDGTATINIQITSVQDCPHLD
jgi:hypothetical protein